MESALLKVRNLKVHFPTQDGLVKAVNGVNYNLKKKEILAIVGESGSGKSVGVLVINSLGGFIDETNAQ